MNTKTHEYGLILNGVSHSDIKHLSDDEMYLSEDLELCIESPPFQPDELFVSFGDFIGTLPQPPINIESVVKAIKNIVPNAVPVWGDFHTER